MLFQDSDDRISGNFSRVTVIGDPEFHQGLTSRPVQSKDLNDFKTILQLLTRNQFYYHSDFSQVSWDSYGILMDFIKF